MPQSLTPSMLVAPPSLVDPPFNESVLILCGHQKNGSLGFILNRPIGITIRDLLEDLDHPNPIHTDKPVLFGGPVEKNYGFILYEHKRGKELAPGFNIGKNLSISPARKILDLAALGKLPGRFELLLGYASWTPGQLKKEMSHGAWLHLPIAQELIFDVPPEDRWQSSFDIMGIKPYAFMYVKGGAQA